MTGVVYRSAVPAGRHGFGALLRAEWTKFRTVRAWVAGLAVAVLVTIALGVLAASGSHTSAAGPNGPTTPPPVPVGPGGEAVVDGYPLLHRTLDGDGSITARLTGMTGAVLDPGGAPSDENAVARPAAVAPWAKAGVIVKDGTNPGSRYAAVLLTGAHGVRMQYDYTGDIAGPAADPATVTGSAPRWLRLDRAGSTLTGYSSSDGATWTRIGSVDLSGLPARVQIGLFVASPAHDIVEQSLGGSKGDQQITQATATFDNIAVTGATSDDWTETKVGGQDTPGRGHADATAVGYTITGSGDVAPDANADTAGSLQHLLVGVFAGIAVAIVVAVLFITAEYRRAMIRTSLAASPRRARVLAAKAIVVGTATFVTGLVAIAIVLPLGRHLIAAGGHPAQPVPDATLARLVVGTAALMAVAAVLALGLGALLRQSVAAVATGVVLIVVPYILTTAAILPPTAADWVLRLTPAAAFAVQQTIPAYHQVDGYYTPAMGFYPLAPWLGFAVLCAWAAAAFGLAMRRLRREDA